MCKDETRKRQSRLVFVGDVIQISTHFNFVKLNIFFLTHADIYSESDSDSESEFDKDDSEDDEEPCPSRGKPVVSAAQRKQSSKKKPRSASGKKLLQDSEFTSILKTATTPDVGELCKQLLASLEKMGAKLFQMGKILVNSAEFSQLHTRMLQAFHKQCLTIYRRKEIKLADKKAELCASWMKYLDNFKPGRNTEERKFLQAVFKGDEFSAHEIHSVSKQLHQSVYSLIHENAHETKKKEHFSETAEGNSPSEESTDKIYSFAGSALHRMKKSRERALAGKGSEVRQSRRPTVEAELRFLEMLSHNDKQQVKKSSTFLRELDFAEGSEKGGLTLPASELKSFLRELDVKVRELINTKNHKRYGKSLLRIAEDSLISDRELPESFARCVATLCTESSPTPDIVKSLCKELIKKYLHAREGEFKQALEELTLTKTGAVVSASQNLRDSLKTYSVTQKRKR